MTKEQALEKARDIRAEQEKLLLALDHPTYDEQIALIAAALLEVQADLIMEWLRELTKAVKCSELLEECVVCRIEVHANKLRAQAEELRSKP